MHKRVLNKIALGYFGFMNVIFDNEQNGFLENSCLKQNTVQESTVERKTKIIATIGPKSSDLNTVQRMVQAGVNVIRINFAHSTTAECEAIVHTYREACKNLDIEPCICADLQVRPFMSMHVRNILLLQISRCGSPGATMYEHACKKHTIGSDLQVQISRCEHS